MGGAVHQRTSGAGSFNASGFELGAKIGIGAFEAVAYGFDASGLGLSTVGALYLSPFGKTDGKGYFVQGDLYGGQDQVRPQLRREPR